MSKMVSARIPSALYEQASSQLADMGSSPTALVKAACEYLLEEHELPTPAKRMAAGTKRNLSAQQRKQLRQKLDACTLHPSIPVDLPYDKQTIADAKSAKHAALG